jgi:VCBS repeat-containing protein
LDGDSLNYSLTTTATNGTVTINPATGDFTYTPNANFNGPDSFVVLVADGKGGTTTSRVTVGVTPVNDLPTSADLSFTTNEDEAVTGKIVASDLDGDSLNYSLTTTATNGTVTINPATGEFTYTPNTNFNGPDSFVVLVADGKGGTTTSRVTVGVTPVNDLPTSADLSFTTNEDVAVTGKIVASDLDGDSLNYSITTTATNGTVTINPATGDFTYTPNANFNGPDSFVVLVADGKGGTTTSRVTVGVTPVNDVPVAGNDNAVTNENTAVTIAVRANDSDPDGHNLIVIGVTQGTHGSVVIDPITGNPLYTPNSGFAGNDSFTYTISDGAGGSAMATVNVTVNPVNQAPVAVAESITVAEGGVATRLNGGATSVLANDSDIDGDPITAVLVSGPAHGSLVLNPNGTFGYVHNGGEATSDKFSYRVNDGTVDGNLVEVMINITPVNDAPVGVTDKIEVNEGSSAAVLVSGATSVLANDLDAEGTPLTAILVSGPNNGTLTLNADGTFSYVHNGSETRVDQFSYRVNDGSANGNIVTVDIVVTPVNDLPVSNDVVVSGNEDTPMLVNLSGSDFDGSVAGYVVKSLPPNGVLYSDMLMVNPIVIGTLVSSPIYFMPDADWNGRTGFTYVARDNESGEDLTPAIVTIDVMPVADAALVGVGSGNVKEDTPAQTSVSGILAITDGDAGEALFNARADSPGAYGSFSIDASGNWTYVLDNSKPDVQALKEGETREDTFSVTSLDGTSTSVTVRVSGTNDGPVATADTATVKQNTVLILTPAQLLGNDFDADGDSLSIESVQGEVNGMVSLVGGNIVFTPTPGYHGPASFTYTLSDGKGGSSTTGVTITVIPNNAPEAGVDTDGALPYSVALGDASPTDSWTNPDSKGKGVYITAYKTSGEATLLYTGAVDGNNNVLGVEGTPRTRSDVPNQIEYNVATGKSESILLTLHGNLNQASFGVSRLYPGESGGEVGMWEAYYNGVLVASRTFRLSGTAEYGTFTIDTGNLPFNSIRFSALHTNNNTGDGGDYFLTSFAGSGPASMNSNLSVVADTPNTLNASMLLANDTDMDGDSLVITSVQDGINGSVSLVGGNVVFTPATAYTGPASFTYTVEDGRGGTDTATVHLMVERINHAPATAADTQATGIGTAINIPASTLLANDTDADGDSFMLVSVQDAVDGSVTLSGSNVIFTPTANYEGPASFTYTVRDTLGATSTAMVNVGVGTASAPSLVVSKSLVAIAHGSGGASVKFPIITKLVDTDGSESLSIKVSGVPTSLSFNAGTNLGGGIWQFTEADLPNLTLNLPGNYSTTTSGINLTVQVISTEANGGFTASAESGVTLKAAFTTTDITTTDAGNYSGNSANEYILGGTGNNTIHGGNGNNIIDGGAGNDSLSAGSGSDVIYGGSGDDVINTGSGTDRIYGGSGNDTLKAGNAGENSVDVFVWTLNDQGAAGAPAVDTLQNFSTTAAGINANGGDVLDLCDLLQGEALGPNNSAGNLADYLHFEIAGGNTLVHISHTGGFNADSHSVGGGYTNAAETQQIVLEGVNLQTIYAGATSDQQIITQLLNNNKLITD